MQARYACVLACLWLAAPAPLRAAEDGTPLSVAEDCDRGQKPTTTPTPGAATRTPP